MYHGTCRLFSRFELGHLGEGEGKSKFGHGIYLTSSRATAAMYAAKAAQCNHADTLYIYSIEIPDLTPTNHLFSCRCVHPDIVERVGQALGIYVPQEAIALGKYYRKFLANHLIGNMRTVKQMIGSASAEAENAVTAFLPTVGVPYLAWPHSQSNPDGDVNVAVLDTNLIRILGIEQVEVDAKRRLIAGSERQVTV